MKKGKLIRKRIKEVKDVDYVRSVTSVKDANSKTW